MSYATSFGPVGDPTHREEIAGYLRSFAMISVREEHAQELIYEMIGEKPPILVDPTMLLYTGTPCQIAGLRAYLGGTPEGLYLADIICHGTPAFDSLRRHIREIEGEYGKTADRLSFRDEAYQFNLMLSTAGQVFYSKSSIEDLWYMGFNKGLFYKEACYQCPFADRRRVSDITMGDFWGLRDKELSRKAKHGVSVLLVNTERGRELCRAAGELLQMTERDTEEAVRGNNQLRHPTPYNRNREKFYRLLERYDFQTAAKRSLRIVRVKYWIARKLGI